MKKTATAPDAIVPRTAEISSSRSGNALLAPPLQLPAAAIPVPAPLFPTDTVPVPSRVFPVECPVLRKHEADIRTRPGTVPYTIFFPTKQFLT